MLLQSSFTCVCDAWLRRHLCDGGGGYGGDRARARGVAAARRRAAERAALSATLLRRDADGPRAQPLLQGRERDRRADSHDDDDVCADVAGHAVHGGGDRVQHPALPHSVRAARGRVLPDPGTADSESQGQYRLVRLGVEQGFQALGGCNVHKSWAGPVLRCSDAHTMSPPLAIIPDLQSSLKIVMPLHNRSFRTSRV